jgi:lipopolysaccharide biosynthesis glycosyltransferase
MEPLPVFIGWDSREPIAYDVCKLSLERHTSIPLLISPIKQTTLRQSGVYTRGVDPLSSTEFSFTRFLTPYLNCYKGWALFIDCDFLFRADVVDLLDYCDEKKAVLCVQHNYNPKETKKMDGKTQTVYPRKNWSSFMLINCAHAQVRALTPDVVNKATGLYLHRFQWLDDNLIGSLPLTWNYLEGWNDKFDCPDPAAIHFTRGGPWFPNYQGVEYADEWLQLAKEFKNSSRASNLPFLTQTRSKIPPITLSAT